MKHINVTRSSMPLYEEYCEEIKELWESRWLTNNGKKHQEFTQGLKQYLGVSNVTLYVNGHMALENALEVLKFPLGSEVITTPFTFASTTHAIVRCGLTPVFCDINPIDYTIDVDRLESLVTEKTVAILPVHVYGNLCDVKRIREIADHYHLKVIYDAAHAFGVSYQGKSAAAYGDFSMFSFHATKVFHSIEGGMLAYGDAEMTERLNDWKNFGIHSPEETYYCGGNAKMNEFSAAMGICNLRHLEVEIARRHAVVNRYRERLTDIVGIRLCPTQNGVKSNYAYFPVVFDGYKCSRDEIFEKLYRQGIVARKYFYPLTNGETCFAGMPFYGVEKTPVADYIANRVLTLPLYADLALEDVDLICDVICNGSY